MFIFFFFSSRRRHTRSLCDWSSDVCSSDLSPFPILWGCQVPPALSGTPGHWARPVQLFQSLAVHDRDLGNRSEEHTSELQSHSDLVCRLLLEKKKNTQQKPFNTQQI